MDRVSPILGGSRRSRSVYLWVSMGYSGEPARRGPQGTASVEVIEAKHNI